MSKSETELRKCVRGLVYDIDPDLRVTFKHIGNEYNSDNDSINIDLTDDNDMGFMRHLREVHKCKLADKYGLLLWTVLHEIGHHFTFEDCDTDWDVVEKLEDVTPEEISSSKELQDLYYGTEEEWKATKWAIRYARLRSSLCQEYDELFKRYREATNGTVESKSI